MSIFLLKANHRFIHMLLRADPAGLGCLLDFLAVLVGAGQEVDRLLKQPVVARQDIRQYGRVRMPDMGLIVDVINWRRDVEGGGH